MVKLRAAASFKFSTVLRWALAYGIWTEVEYVTFMGTHFEESE